MEKPARSKSIVLSFLSKSAAVTFLKPPFSPGHDKNSSKFKGYTGKGLSSPVVSIVPTEARRKLKSGSFHGQEPTSPKVSCIGQIKHKKKICQPSIQDRKKPFAVGKVFDGAKTVRRKSDADADKVIDLARVPSLSQMKRFSSGRGAFANFNWMDHREYNFDEKNRERDEEDEFVAPPLAPPVVGDGEALGPRTEVKLWKRRSMDRP